MNSSDKKQFPVVEICDFVHLVEDGFCIAAIVSGVAENYEESGQVIVHMMLPIPQTPAVCAPGMPVYEYPPQDKNVPKTNKTWHFAANCYCAKRIPNKAPSRIVMPSTIIQ